MKIPWFIRPFSSFSDPATMPLRERWSRALRDPAYLGMYVGLYLVLGAILGWGFAAKICLLALWFGACFGFLIWYLTKDIYD